MIRPIFWPDNKPGTAVPGAAIHQLVTLFSQGKVVLGDSDTVLGLYAPLTKEGFLALNRLKKRVDKPYLVLVADKERALSLIAEPVSPILEALMDACWPGAVTLICKARLYSGDSGVSSFGYAVSGWGTIGLRVPDHVGLQQLLPHFEGLFSTSANITGNPVPQSLGQVDPEIAHAVAGIVLNRDSVLEPDTPDTFDRNTALDRPRASAVASTILDCTALTGADFGKSNRADAKNSQPEIKLIREGGYPVSLIEEKLRQGGVIIKIQ